MRRRWRCDLGLALDRGGAGAFRQVDERAGGAERIGKRHDGAAVKDEGTGAEILIDGPFVYSA